MDTIHDLGGREGFGPIRWQDDNDSKPFHEPWQARTWAMCMLMFGQFRDGKTGWTLDWSRHVIERITPADYLAMNYFDKWGQHLMAILIDEGVAEVQEFVEGRSHRNPPARVPTPLSASTEPGVAKYAVGDLVLAKRSIASMHTRLPAYVRGRKGVVDTYIGAAILADASAAGDIRKEPLYAVRFEAAELWPESTGRRAAVYLDLWESYLERA
jgi:nitrile hydratase beta subunit